MARLNAGGSAPHTLGPLKQLAVQKGDTVTVTAPGYYPQAVQSSSFAFSLASFVAGLLQQQPAPAPGADGSRRAALPLLSIGVSAALPALVKPSGGVPLGYVRLLVFDADSNLVSQQVQTRQLSAAAASGYEPLTVQVIAQQDGYVTAYVGNESNADVYFDDVSVTLGQGLQVQENSYDPWGLSLAGLDYASLGIKGLSQYQFNGKERQNDLGLSWSDYGARMYDGQLGRWHAADPMAAKYSSLTPYNYVGNHPTIITDPDGRDFNISVTRDENGAITGVNISSTVYIRGAGASEERADELTNYAATNLPADVTGNVKVSFNVKYKLFNKDSNKKLGPGENILDFNATPEQSTNDPYDSRSEAFGAKPSTGPDGQPQYSTGNTGIVYGSGKNSRTVLHETMHMMGLSDRYDDDIVEGGVLSWKPQKGFEQNIMGGGNSVGLNKFQYQSYLNAGYFNVGQVFPSILRQDIAPGYNRYVDKFPNSGIPYTPYEKGGVHDNPNPVNKNKL